MKNFARLDGIVTLVDAKHIEQHLDEEKPVGAENEAVEQVAFADRLLLNKTDLVDDGDLVRIEARIRSINKFAPIQRCQHSQVDVSSVLNINGFDLQRTLEMDPEFLNTDGEHEHDASVTSLSIVKSGDVDLGTLEDWLHTLLQTRGGDLYRMKGLLAISGTKERFVFQAVHMIFKWQADHAWPDGEKRMNKLVFIGRNLDHVGLRAGFDACITSPDLTQRKVAHEAAAERISSWARDSLPAEFSGESVTVEQARCSMASCPLQTLIRVMLPKPKELTLLQPLVSVTCADVAAEMGTWAGMIQRAKSVHGWAHAALPDAVAGERLLVEEVETTHVDDAVKVETHIHILATPPWSMKVLKRLEDVTQKNVADLMQYAALCGAQGVPSVR